MPITGFVFCDKIEENVNEKPNFGEDDEWALIKVTIAYARVCVEVATKYGDDDGEYIP